MGKYGIYLGNELLEFYDFDKVTLYLKNISNLKNILILNIKKI